MIKNIKNANKTITTAHGTLNFDSNGVATEATKEQVEKLSKISGYEIVKEAKKEEPKKTKKAVEKTDKKRENKRPYTKTELKGKTVPEIEAIAKKDFDIIFDDEVKREKIEQILKAQK